MEMTRITTAQKRASPGALFFFHQFLKSPGSIGSIIPTSRIGIAALLDPIDWRTVRCVAEYGPGTGVVTRALLDRLGPDARLIAIDINPAFTGHLRRVIDDPRLVVIDDSAVNVEAILAAQGYAHADYVISGLPLSTQGCALTQSIMDATARAVRPGGALLTYQYSMFAMSLLRKRFARVDLGRAWRCLPPLRLFYAWRAA